MEGHQIADSLHNPVQEDMSGQLIVDDYQVWFGGISVSLSNKEIQF